MPSPEHFYQPRPLEAAPTDSGEQAAQTPTSPRMEQVVTQLAAKHGVDFSQRGTLFSIDRPNNPQRWLIGNIDGERIGVTRCAVDENNRLTPDLDMVFDVTPGGWEPVEIVHASAAWQDYINTGQGRPIADAQGDFDFGAFADHWAQQIEEEVR